MADHKPFAGLSTEETLAAMFEEFALRLCDIADSVGNLSPDLSGRIRVAAETVANIGTVTTVTTVSTVSNVASIGGLSAAQEIIALTQLAEMALRRNIVIS